MIIKNAGNATLGRATRKKIQSGTTGKNMRSTHSTYALRRPRVQGYRKISDMPVEYLADMIRNREEMEDE